MSPHIARQVVGFFHRSPQPKPEDSLTPREQEVLDLLIKGMFYKEIAGQLSISLDTVRSHVRKIYGKLQIHSAHRDHSEIRQTHGVNTPEYRYQCYEVKPNKSVHTPQLPPSPLSVD
jgi:DNA-binding NarL/FixJ family response regulator